MMLPEFDQLDAIDMARMVREREVSPSELLEAAIERTEARNPALNAVVHTMYDEGRKQIDRGLAEGPFKGVPFLIKDIGLEYAGVPTRGGSHVFDHIVPRQHTTLTQLYLDAGLVVFGKTSTPELGNSGTSEAEAYGPTRNPWDLSRSPGGSSGGSAAAVAARIVPMANGGDGGGSIRNPASQCGIFGLKTTRGRVSLGPRSFEGNNGLSVLHGLTRSVRDSAALLDASARSMPGDAYVAPKPDRPFLSEVGRTPGKLRIGFHTTPHHDVEIDPECIRAVEEAARFLSKLGHDVEPFTPEIDGMLFQDVNLVLWGTNNLNNLSRVLDISEDLTDHPKLEWITGRIAEQAKRFSALDHAQARQNMHTLSRQVAAPFAKYDLILSPVVSQRPWPLGVYETGFKSADEYFSRVYDYSPFCWPYNVSGQPAMSIPFHWTPERLPVGIMFAARYGDEATLFRLARQIELEKPWDQILPEMCQAPDAMQDRRELLA
ncbi:amidase [Roseibium sp. SCP14]|uniref:amidase n=1 Tax=Roseibium sp. SCP14 TaxID=3141375 RepID=UPI00333B36BD